MSRADQEKLYQAIGNIRDDLVEQAQSTPMRQSVKKARWSRRLAIAACLCAAVGIGWGMTHLRMGASNGGSGHDESSTFMSYAGPVFPLTLLEENKSITAEREITLDFAGYVSRQKSTALEDGTVETYENWSSTIQVTDSYVLTNSTNADVTVTAAYPFAGDFLDLKDQSPNISVDDTAADTALYAGGYSGGFTDVYGGDDSELGFYNLNQLLSWEEYRDLLADGSYQAGAFAEPPELTEPVTVYEFADSRAPEGYSAATMAIHFNIDPERTTILTWGINGMEWDNETGDRRYSYFVHQNARIQERRLLIVLGDDIGNYTLAGYENGACEKELDGVSTNLTRRTSALGEVLEELVVEYRRENARTYGEEDLSTIPDNLLLAAFSGAARDYIATVARYDTGRLDDVFIDAVVMDRVFYLTFSITIPAGGSVTVTAELKKEASQDFVCAHTENRGVYGYDLVTRLGSNLIFTGQRAALANTELVEIVRQNFGFDLQNGVTTVELDLNEGHYYLEVRRLTGDDSPSTIETVKGAGAREDGAS